MDLPDNNSIHAPLVTAERRGPGRPMASDPTGDELREQIVAASARVYAARGYHGSSVARILEVAGISRPTFYRYFRDRYEVLDVLIGRVNDDLRACIESAAAGADDLDELLESVVDAYLNWGTRIGPLSGPIYREIHDPASPASVHRVRILRDLTHLFMGSAADGINVAHEPLLYEAAIHVVEHLGHHVFWPKPVTRRERLRRRAIILRALHGMLVDARDD